MTGCGNAPLRWSCRLFRGSNTYRTSRLRLLRLSRTALEVLTSAPVARTFVEATTTAACALIMKERQVYTDTYSAPALHLQYNKGSISIAQDNRVRGLNCTYVHRVDIDDALRFLLT